MQQKLNLKQIFLASPDLARSRKGRKDLLSDQGRYKNWERGGIKEDIENISWFKFWTNV